MSSFLTLNGLLCACDISTLLSGHPSFTSPPRPHPPSVISPPIFHWTQTTWTKNASDDLHHPSCLYCSVQSGGVMALKGGRFSVHGHWKAHSAWRLCWTFHRQGHTYFPLCATLLRLQNHSSRLHGGPRLTLCGFDLLSGFFPMQMRFVVLVKHLESHLRTNWKICICGKILTYLIEERSASIFWFHLKWIIF